MQLQGTGFVSRLTHFTHSAFTEPMDLWDVILLAAVVTVVVVIEIRFINYITEG